jgi:hypothetical protein
MIMPKIVDDVIVKSDDNKFQVRITARKDGDQVVTHIEVTLPRVKNLPEKYQDAMLARLINAYQQQLKGRGGSSASEVPFKLDNFVTAEYDDSITLRTQIPNLTSKEQADYLANAIFTVTQNKWIKYRDAALAALKKGQKPSTVELDPSHVAAVAAANADVVASNLGVPASAQGVIEQTAAAPARAAASAPAATSEATATARAAASAPAPTGSRATSPAPAASTTRAAASAAQPARSRATSPAPAASPARGTSSVPVTDTAQTAAPATEAGLGTAALQDQPETGGVPTVPKPRGRGFRCF